MFHGVRKPVEGVRRSLASIRMVAHRAPWLTALPAWQGAVTHPGSGERVAVAAPERLPD